MTIVDILRRYSPMRQDDLAKKLGRANNIFSPSQNSKYREVLLVLLQESMIAKIKKEKSTYYKMLRPMEEIEAMMLKYKWDKRHQKTKDLDIPCKVIKPKINLEKAVEKAIKLDKKDTSKAKAITIQVKDVTITILF